MASARRFFGIAAVRCDWLKVVLLVALQAPVFGGDCLRARHEARHHIGGAGDEMRNADGTRQPLSQDVVDGLHVTAETANTPVKRLYFCVQMMYLKNDIPRYRTAYLGFIKELREALPGSRDVIDAAHAAGVAIIPLVVNKDVDPDVGHAILSDPARRAALARNLVNEAKTYGYGGFQLDFEQIPWTDRDLLTALAQDCGSAFHAAGLNLSIAVIPRLPGDDAASGTLLDYFHQWSGAYDFAGLARAADFLSFMTYDEHNGVTPPGPVSGTPWIRRALEFSMQGVPPEKATLGLPTYYHDWTGVGRLTSSSYADAMILAAAHGATPAFDATEEEMHFGYNAYGVHHELWIQSTDTLRRKLPLMYEYGMKGISVWRLGFEDPSFWNLIPARR